MGESLNTVTDPRHMPFNFHAPSAPISAAHLITSSLYSSLILIPLPSLLITPFQTWYTRVSRLFQPGLSFLSKYYDSFGDGTQERVRKVVWERMREGGQLEFAGKLGMRIKGEWLEGRMETMSVKWASEGVRRWFHRDRFRWYFLLRIIGYYYGIAKTDMIGN